MMTGAQKRLEEIKKLVDKADEKLIKQFLISTLNDDPILSTCFKSAIEGNLTADEVVLFKNKIDQIVIRNSGKRHYIDYYNAQYFCIDMEEFIYKDVQKLIDIHQYRAAFSILIYVFTTIDGIDIDDSCNTTGQIADTISEFLLQVLEESEVADKKLMLKYLKDLVEKHNSYGLEIYIERVLADGISGRDSK